MQMMETNCRRMILRLPQIQSYSLCRPPGRATSGTDQSTETGGSTRTAWAAGTSDCDSVTAGRKGENIKGVSTSTTTSTVTVVRCSVIEAAAATSSAAPHLRHYSEIGRAHV